MDYDELIVKVIELLRREKRVPYRVLKRRFDLDDEYIEDLKIDLTEAKQLAIDENGRILVWIGDTDSAGAPEPLPVSPALKDQQPPPISYTPKYLTEKILTSRSALEGERKQVTVLFADIKDSTELIKDLDPEAAQKLLDPAIHIMMEAVHRFEGTVNQVLGDGVMSIFGAPIAHEDHAARACYAALAMQAAMQPYAEEILRAHGITMRIRVGLNSGEVVVRTIGNDLHMDYSAVGQTTHLASRMEQLAAPGSVVLTAATLRLVEGLVRVNALGPVPVKGMTEPVGVYELTDASSIKRRLQAAVARGLTKFVGRDIEIDALNQALERAEAGHGQMVAAVGEAGVGKSRLVYEFVHSHRTQGWRVLESASVSYGKATPYFPVVDLLKRYVHIEDGDDPRTTRAKVTGQILTLDESLQETIPALLSLLDALPDDSPFLQLDPPQRRQRTLNGLKRVLLRESQVQPLLLVFEDLHWIDSETQASLDSLVESLPTAQLLMLVNYRPEYQHSWGSKTYYTQLRLDPLPPESADAFLEALLGNDPSLEPLKKLLIERTEGNPFFLEESVRTLVETQVLVGESGAYRLTQELPTIQVPATVQAVLAARIDRLPQDEKRLLQTAAVIGTEVPFPLLQAIADIPEEALHRGLTHLQAAEFLYETSLFPERVYTFKHALTHEVTYGSLLQERRRGLHARILEALEALEGDRRTEQVEHMAYHAFRGEVWDKALRYFRQAGRKAMARSASREAVVRYEQALAAGEHLPERRDLHEQAIDLQLELRSARIVLSDFEGILNDLREAESLATSLDDAQRLGRVYLHMGINYYFTGENDQATAFCQRALDLAMTGTDAGFQAQAHNYLGVISHDQGEYARSRDHGRQARTLLTGDLLYERFGEAVFPAVITRTILAFCLAELGAFAEGVTMGTEGLHMAEAVKHPASIMFALWSAGITYLRQGELRQALSLLERGVHLCREANLTLYFSAMATALGAAYILDGRIAEALPLLEEAVAQAVSIGRMARQALHVATLSEAHLHAGHLEAASTFAEQALVLSRTHKERGHEAYVLRLLGDIAMHRHPSDIDQAKTHYQQALALAEDLGMRPLQAHCHRGLGTLYRRTGQSEQARAELSTAIEMYRDMEMTFWLPETEAALAQVESR
jgi:class 3 adenylate cyclase/tetratricopeptide (TPR) repeat protein